MSKMHAQQVIDDLRNQFKEIRSIQTSMDDLYKSSFTNLIFTSKQTGVTRFELSAWNKADLLPYKIVRNETADEEEKLKASNIWRRYSLLECLWIWIIVKLKKFGIQDAFILDLKNEFFQDVELREKGEPEEDKSRKLRESTFGNFLMHATMHHINFSILVSEDGEFAIIDHDSASANNIYRAYRDKTYLTINVSSLMKSFIASDEVNMDTDYYISLLHPKERAIIKQIQENAFKQVTLSLRDGSITHYRISKDKKANSETIKSIARMLKKEDYQSIQCAAIDDTVVTFEEEALTSLV